MNMMFRCSLLIKKIYLLIFRVHSFSSLKLMILQLLKSMQSTMKLMQQEMSALVLLLFLF